MQQIPAKTTTSVSRNPFLSFSHISPHNTALTNHSTDKNKRSIVSSCTWDYDLPSRVSALRNGSETRSHFKVLVRPWFDHFHFQISYILNRNVTLSVLLLLLHHLLLSLQLFYVFFIFILYLFELCKFDWIWHPIAMIHWFVVVVEQVFLLNSNCNITGKTKNNSIKKKVTVVQSMPKPMTRTTEDA